ncbi:MAG TPA: ABC transporter ATP-binding protein [Polyangiaceae bacterium]|nr:ABC transporter ATP-binding protein [Polyangiaceae bacterium]
MIEIEDLYKYYGDRRVVGPLSARIEKGEIVGFLGLNGAGKTTTLRVLACDLLPTSGRVKVGGFDVVEQPHEVRGKVGYLPDRPPLYDDMSVHEYLSYAARLKRVRPNDVERRVSDVEGMTELGDVRNQLVGTLSHGYRQRLGIAQAIVHRPDFVVLDEPIGGLDPLQIVEMRKLVRGLRGEHTVVVSSHILHEISETCDRILVIQNGEILWSGKESDLSTQVEQGMRIRVTGRVAGAAPADALERVSALAKGVSGVSSVEAREPTETGDGIASVEVIGETDVRDALCRALVTGDVGVLEVSRLRDLETTFRALLEGSSS